MSILDTLAEVFREKTDLPGVDWSKSPYEDQMAAEERRLIGILRRLQLFEGLSMSASEARRSIDDVKDRIESDKEEVMSAIKTGRFVLGEPVRFPQATLRAAISASAAFALNGAMLHRSGIMRQAFMDGDVSEADLKEHADDTMQMMRAIIQMDRDNELDVLAGNGASGLGVAWVPIIIAVAGVLAIAGIALLIVNMKRVTEVQKRGFDICELLAKQGKSSAAVKCVEALAPISKAGLGFGFGRALNTVAIFAGVGLLGFVGVKYLLPEVMKQRAP